MNTTSIQSRPPVIFIHYGNSDYLRYTLAQAALACPDRPVYLIGDQSNSSFPFVRHFMHGEFSKSAFHFAEQYCHLSGNHPSFELFCFQRWLILRDFMLLQRIERAVYVDSDMLIYDNFDEDWDLIKNTPLAVNNKLPPVFINDVRMLDDYCQFLEQSYTEPIQLAALQKLYNDMINSGVIGGICDMTFWDMFKMQRPKDIVDIRGLNQGACFDTNIEESEGVQMQGGIKNIVWNSGQPYGIIDSGELKRFKILHMHGSGKGKIDRFFQAGFESLIPLSPENA